MHAISWYQILAGVLMKTSKGTQCVCVIKLMVVFFFKLYLLINFFKIMIIAVVVNLCCGVTGSFSVKSDKV